MTEYSFTARLTDSTGVNIIAPITSLSLTCDNGWAPRYTAQVEVITTARLVNGAPTVGRLIIERWPGPPVTLAAWTDLWGGKVSTYTADGKTSPGAITLGTGGDPEVLDEPQTLDLILSVREFTPDPITGTATIQLSSVEMDLQEYIRVAANPRTWPEDTMILTVFRDVLASAGMAGVKVTTYSGSADYAVGDRGVWEPGVSPYDFLTAMFDPLNLKFWSEQPGHWVVARALDIDEATPLPRAIDFLEILPRYEPTKRRRTGLVQIREDPESGGRNIISSGIQGTVRGEVIRHEAEGLPPGTTYSYFAGPAMPVKPIRAGATCTAIADLTVRGDQSLVVPTTGWSTPGISPFFIDGTCDRVEFKYPEGTMTLDVAARFQASGALPNPWPPFAP